jgi:hypothetical protein
MGSRRDLRGINIEDPEVAAKPRVGVGLVAVATCYNGEVTMPSEWM